MFTLEQIKDAHSKVRSGADFPAYIQALKKLGVVFYQTYVPDGHTDYYGSNDYKISSGARQDTLTISETANKDQFVTGLKAHQQGQTDYPTFIKMCAACGVEKWIVSIEKMTCTYYDKAGGEVLEEMIPQ